MHGRKCISFNLVAISLLILCEMCTGVSVRKRVIKILREVCLNFPDYPRVPDICSKIIRRINDDGEGE